MRFSADQRISAFLASFLLLCDLPRSVINLGGGGVVLYTFLTKFIINNDVKHNKILF